MIGTIINTVAIIIATFIGILFKKRINESLQKSLMLVLGLSLSILSIGWFLSDFLVVQDQQISTQHDLLIIISLVIGTLIGEKIDIDKRINQTAFNIEKKYNLPPLAKGFSAGTLIFCVGAMAILGSLQAGLEGSYTILYMKSTLDFITAMMLASVFGIGVLFSAFSVLIYQGSITVLAGYADLLLTSDMITVISMVGNIILVAIGINFMDIKKIRVANMLPSLVIPILYFLIIAWI